MTTTPTTKNNPDENLDLFDVDFGIELDTDDVLIDMTQHTRIDGVPLRVELRKARDPATGPLKPSRRIIDSNYVIGLIGIADLPKEGQEFTISYHSWNGLSDFGTLGTREPITQVSKIGDCYHFTTSEGQWRLKILDVGN